MDYLKHSRKLCCNCAYYRNHSKISILWRWKVAVPMCGAPQVSSTVTGEPINTCTEIRGGAICGLEAKIFEPRRK
jgi:hypothetical protein